MRVVLTLLLCLVAGPRWLAEERPREPKVSSVLFIGNSLTFSNDLPSIICRLAAEAGRGLRCESVARPNFSLSDHWGEGAAAKRLRRRDWSVVVMQQGPSGSREGRDMLIEYGAKWNELIVGRGGRSAFYMVWPSAARFSDFPRVSENHRAASANTGGILLPAGDAWIEAWKRDRSLALYGPDGFHPSLAGSYLAALTIYRGLFGDIPAAFTNVETANRSAGGNLRLTEAQLQTLADSVEAVY